MEQNVAFIQTVELADGGLAKYEGPAEEPDSARVRKWIVGEKGHIALSADVTVVPYSDIKGWPTSH
jgi:hypothetical protein